MRTKLVMMALITIGMMGGATAQSSNTSIDSFIVGQQIEGEISETFEVQPDNYYDDGDVTYFYSKVVEVHNGTVLEQGSWERQSFSETYNGSTNATFTVNHQFDREAERLGENAYRILVAEASNEFDWLDTDNDGDYEQGEGNWGSFDINQKATQGYEWEVVTAPEPEEQGITDSLTGFFESIINSLGDTIDSFFGNNPTDLPQPDNPPTPSGE